MVVAAATPRAGSRVKTGGRGGRAGGAAATRRRSAATRRCSRRGLRQGLREGTGMPSRLVAKSTDSRKREIKVKTEQKDHRAVWGPGGGAHGGVALWWSSPRHQCCLENMETAKPLVFGTRSSAVPFQP